jgi:glycerol-3-phosphate acyltransferase PlsY
MIAAVVALLGYQLGSIPSGLIVGRIYRGVDVRDYGSGKTGFTNALRSLGWGAAVVVVLMDIAKGAAPIFIGRVIFDDVWAAALGGTAAVIGHTFPIFAGFRGGRGVATAFGAFVFISPLAGAVIMVGGLLTLFLTRYVSLMSIIATAAGFLVIIVLVTGDWLEMEYLIFGIVVTISIEISHLGNIRRLLSGVEPKLGQGGVSPCR